MDDKHNIVKKNVNLIVAINPEGIIGVDGDIPWHVSEDLRYFKQMTLGKILIMGHKTFKSLKKPLPNRVNVVLSRHIPDNETRLLNTLDINNYDDSPNFSELVFTNNLHNSINYYLKYAKQDIFIIGGSEIFKETLSLVDNLYITLIHVNLDNITRDINNAHEIIYFPDIDYTKWHKIAHNKVISTTGIVCEFQHFIPIE